MSESNVEIAQRLWGAFEQGGFRGIDAWIGLLAEDVELHPAIVGGADGSTYHGHDGVRAWAREVDETLEDLHLRADEYREVGGRVVAIGHVSARGGASGLELDVPIAWVLSIRDGRVATMHGYLDVAAALEAAGGPGARG
jgi:ketosteroid isomerase-like protein